MINYCKKNHYYWKIKILSKLSFIKISVIEVETYLTDRLTEDAAEAEDNASQSAAYAENTAGAEDAAEAEDSAGAKNAADTQNAVWTEDAAEVQSLN